MAFLLTKDWINTVYTNLTDTLANSEHNINSGITKKTFGQEIITDDQINILMNSIQALSNNTYIKNYADCFKNNDSLDTVNTDSVIKEVTKTQIDNYIEDILDICQNQVKTTIAATGNTNYSNNFSSAMGNTNKGNNFSEASGCTNYGNVLIAATGDTNYGNNFSRAFFSQICGNNFREASGCANCGDNFTFTGYNNVGKVNTASGKTNQGNNFYFFATRSASKGVGGTGFTDNFKVVSGGNTNKGNNFGLTGFSTETNARFSGDTNKGNNFSPASGCTNNSNTFYPASGFTNYGNDFSGAFFSQTCGDNFSAASGFTNYGNNFRAASTRVDFKVRISGDLVSNSNIG